ncbi:hypoxia-inducible factor 1-alpha inhibitor-like [Centruroides sculpturatus]|uniref:hypoxia-inducible factor 1-alpha inhibitor-like n=1 Tax=Centruroides sculpturatus TaxID=218467 RepID=UPI000C6D7080|nr:hypoxia-inducible factor 1-alpha inhibitor-like [Centruroides sculpturatus]
MASPQTELKSYDFPLEPIPRLSCLDPNADALIENMKPVVLTDTNLVSSALKWNLDYLQKNLGDGSFTVYISKNHKFKYYDDTKIQEHCLDFTAPTERFDMKFVDFVKRLRKLQANDRR